MLYLNQPIEPRPSQPPSPSLDPVEITVPESVDTDLEADFAEQRRLHLSFRHSFWSRRRQTTYAALHRLFPNTRRLEAFENCGSNAWVLRCLEDPNRYRIRVNACRDRFCEACAVERRRLIARNVVEQLPESRLLFITLTLKSQAIPLRDQLGRITACFHRLRNRSKLRSYFTGGLYFLEVTRNDSSGLWHPHLHAIVDTEFIPHKVLSSEWHHITGDSFIVDIKKVRSTRHVAGYITKYAAKAIPSNVWNNPAALESAIVAFTGKRSFATFGDWKNLDLSKRPDDDAGWITIGPLAVVIEFARAGNGIYVDVLRQLRRRPDHDPQYTDSS